MPGFAPSFTRSDDGWDTNGYIKALYIERVATFTRLLEDFNLNHHTENHHTKNHNTDTSINVGHKKWNKYLEAQAVRRNIGSDIDVMRRKNQTSRYQAQVL